MSSDLAIVAVRGPAWTVGNFVWVDLALGPATALLLAGVAVGRPRTLASLLETRPLQRLGTCSYSLYLTHAPIVVMVRHALRSLDVEPGMPTFLLMLAVAVPIAVVFAMSFASIFEIPFQRHRSWVAWQGVVSGRWSARASAQSASGDADR